MATTLATARAAAATALSAITTAQTYRRRQTNYQYPCFVVGWPTEYDARPTMGDTRDFTVNVWVACEVTDDDSTDDLLSSLLESAVTALQANGSWDVQPITDFDEQLTDDQRTIVSCRLPLNMLA